MEMVKEIIEWIFKIALFLNALLFIPQAIQLIKTKSRGGLSFLTFLGFLIIQFAIVGHGIIQQDYSLVAGYVFSILLCGAMVFLMVYYQKFYVKSLRESTEIKQETLEITEQLGLLESIIALMPGHVYWVDRSGTYLGCNDNQAKSAGLYSRKDIVGKKNSELPWNIHSQVLPYTLDKINAEVMETGKSLVIEEPALLQGGMERLFLSHKVPLYNKHGSIIGMVGISIDITDRKKAEEALLQEKLKAENANKAKTEFLENMRHDIRTPLSGIIGLSQALQKEADHKKIQVFSVELAKASQELLHFLNEVLESIQVGSGEIPLLKKKFSLNDTLEKLVNLHQPIATTKRLSLTLQVDKAIPECLIGDPVRIYRIVLELLGNALKFTQKGQICVSASLATEEEHRVVVKILVEDTGCGISLEKQQDLFIRFKRLTPSYEGIYKGSGLGLSIVKQFLDELQGEIYIESELNRGTRFACILPLKKPLLEEEPVLNPPSSLLKTEMPLETRVHPKLQGLVVEDHPAAALVAKTLLMEQECEIDIAENGTDAIIQAGNKRYDFILMDIGLPDKDGVEVTKAIRQLELTFNHRAFIVGLTAHLEAEKRPLALKAGMDEVFAKPLTPELAMALVQYCMRRP